MLGFVALIFAAFAPRGLRRKAVVGALAPITFVVGTLAIFALTSESMYTWPLFEQWSV